KSAAVQRPRSLTPRGIWPPVFLKRAMASSRPRISGLIPKVIMNRTAFPFQDRRSQTNRDTACYPHQRGFWMLARQRLSPCFPIPPCYPASGGQTQDEHRAAAGGEEVFAVGGEGDGVQGAGQFPVLALAAAVEQGHRAAAGDGECLVVGGEGQAEALVAQAG